MADAARHEEVAPSAQLLGGEVDELRGASQRSGHVDERIAGVVFADFARRGADGLNHEGDAPLGGIVAGDGERDAFAELVGADNDELPGQRRVCDARSLDFHAEDVLRQFALFKNGIHYL